MRSRMILAVSSSRRDESREGLLSLSCQTTQSAPPQLNIYNSNLHMMRISGTVFLPVFCRCMGVYPSRARKGATRSSRFSVLLNNASRSLTVAARMII